MPIINGTANGETLNGTAGQDSIYGLGGEDSLFGLADHDLLDGGEGHDRMEGGTGNDRYVVDDALDVVVEAAGEGDDTLHSGVSYVLGAGVSIETITTWNAASTASINFTGNEFGQSIYGNAGANLLNGGGGADYLVGLGGNDRYIIDNISDSIAEVAGEGDDTLHSSVSYVLVRGVSIEILTTTNAASTDPISLTGNEIANSIYGNAGANVLNGGAGVDYLVGLGGNDLYILDWDFDDFNFSDVIIEAPGEGDDTLQTFFSYQLGEGVSIETMTTTNEAGTEALALTGNEFGQSIYGNAVENRLSGGGGADYLVGLGGNDLLNGGTGADNLLGGDGVDTFQFSNLETGDRILDFTSGIDKIDLGDFVSDQNFQFLGSGSFTGWPAQGRYADGVFQLDLNGDGIADLEFSLTGPLVESDFIFAGSNGWDY